MAEHKGLGVLHVLTGIVGLIAPLSAVLYEAGHFRFFPTDMVHDLWLLVVVAALGAGIGIVAFAKGARMVGAACFLSNGAVFVLYGFIAAFFALGGSR